MAEQEEDTTNESCWLNWCRLCGRKDNTQGKVKIYTNETENTENTVVEMAIRKFFDVHMQENDEPYGVVCETCYTFMIKLIDFAEHVTKVQAIFKLLRNTPEKPEIYESPNAKDLPEIPPKKDNINPLSVDEVSYRSHKRNNPMSGEGKRSIGSTKRKLNTKSEIEKIKLRRDDDTECSQATTASSITPNIEQTNSQELISSDTTESDLKTLSSQSGKKNKKTYSCDLCNKTLSSATSLKMHKECMHDKSTPFMCDDCGKQLKTKTALNEHKLVHTEERPFVCTICNGAFKNRVRLRRHLQIHSEPSYECEICGKKLQTRAIWNKHKLVHTNERRFKCTICGTASKNSTALKAHLLSHTGLKPYACKYCHKEFACGVNCREHKKKMHPVEYAQDDDKSSRIANVPTVNELRVIAAGMEKTAPLRTPRALKK